MKNYTKRQIRKWKLIKIFFYILYFFTTFSVTLTFKVSWIVSFLLILSGIMLVIANFASEKESNFNKGKTGELLIENELKSISGIYAFRDILLGDKEPWNIDFVVLSKAGVFIFEVKAYEGRIAADNDLWYQYIHNRRRAINSFSKQVRGNALKLREYLSNKNPGVSLPFFTPVVVLTKPFERTDIKNDINKTQVVSPNEISRLVSTGSKIGPEQLKFLVEEMNKLGNNL